MADMDILGMLGPEIIENMMQSIQEQDTPKMQQLAVCRTQLVNLTAQLTELNQRQTLFNNSYSSYFTSMSNMLSTDTAQAVAALQQQSAAAAQDAELDQIMTQLLQVEHQIMELLDPKTATHTYAIYYDIDGSESGTLIRGEISAEDLYESGALKVVGNKLMLARSDAIKAIQERGTSQAFTKDSEGGKKYGEIAQQAIQDMKDVLDHLEKEYSQVEEQKRQAHLGAELWRRYCKLQRLFKYESNVRSLYNRYTLSAVRGWSLRGMDYNRGQLVEAFERWFQGKAGSTGKLLEESSDNLPWFAGGDVDDVQVKALFSSTSQYESAVKVASISSILALANELLSLMLTPEEWLKRAQQAVQMAIDSGDKQGSINILERLKRKIQEMLEQKILSG